MSELKRHYQGYPDPCYDANEVDAYLDKHLPKWASVEDRLPKGGVRVLFSWINSHGNRRTGLGFYVTKYWMSADCFEDAEDCCDYIEPDETYWVPEGWHEEPHESEFFHTTPTPTHWMPLPEAPKEVSDE